MCGDSLLRAQAQEVGEPSSSSCVCFWRESAAWSPGSPSDLLSSSDHSEMFQGPSMYNQNPKDFSVTGKKKCFLRFSSAIQNPEADFCSCCWRSFFLSVQVSNNTNTVGTSWIAGDRNTLLGSLASSAISWVLKGLQLKPVWTWNLNRKVFVFS